MDSVFKKMNFKDHSQVLVLNAPGSFSPNMAGMKGLTTFVTDIAAVDKVQFVLAFVTQQEEVDTLFPQIAEKLEGDAVVWFAYPKQSSKKYTSKINRDNGWEISGYLGLEPVRAVAVDADWSGIRFRKVAFIKKLTRRKSMALTEEAKKRTTGK